MVVCSPLYDLYMKGANSVAPGTSTTMDAQVKRCKGSRLWREGVPDQWPGLVWTSLFFYLVAWSLEKSSHN